MKKILFTSPLFFFFLFSFFLSPLNVSAQVVPTVVISLNNTTFTVGDTFTLSLTGTPNSPIWTKVLRSNNGTIVQNDLTATQVAMTDASGHYGLTFTTTSAMTGSWSQVWSVGTDPITAPYTTIQFTINSSSTSGTSGGTTSGGTTGSIVTVSQTSGSCPGASCFNYTAKVDSSLVKSYTAPAPIYACTNVQTPKGIICVNSTLTPESLMQRNLQDFTTPQGMFDLLFANASYSQNSAALIAELTKSWNDKMLPPCQVGVVCSDTALVNQYLADIKNRLQSTPISIFTPAYPTIPASIIPAMSGSIFDNIGAIKSSGATGGGGTGSGSGTGAGTGGTPTGGTGGSATSVSVMTDNAVRATYSAIYTPTQSVAQNAINSFLGLPQGTNSSSLVTNPNATAAQIQTQINTLLAQVQQLQAQLVALNGGSSGATSATTGASGSSSATSVNSNPVSSAICSGSGTGPYFNVTGLSPAQGGVGSTVSITFTEDIQTCAGDIGGYYSLAFHPQAIGATNIPVVPATITSLGNNMYRVSAQIPSTPTGAYLINLVLTSKADGAGTVMRISSGGQFTVDSSTMVVSTGSTFPATMTVTATALNERSSPSTTAPIIGTLSAGQSITVIGSTVGESVSGNSVWWQLDTGKYVWSGGVSSPSI